MTGAPDREYSPSYYARDVEDTLARQAAAGRRLVERHAPCRLVYGDDPLACLHLFVPPGPGPWPLMAFIHGGYWQELDHTATDFLAERYLAQGMAFASLGYGLAPATSLETMSEQCARGLAAALDRLAERSSVGAVTLGGHSAGAQLACRVAAEGSTRIDELLLVSGVYDLAPLVDTYVNAPLGLDRDRARALSPLHGELASLPSIRVVIAEHDPPTFRRQGRDFVTAVRDIGGQAEFVDRPGCDHFDVLEHLDAVT
ncbi:alpha/beta hydrolase [Halomonas eurihalina]|uniref:Alpha/beta hydrolase n=1 Tax=Halomonas eurihalina TaxID=42566 RepID=A0A5D9D802_HALER|nr:alpha/beta hydrolase [Halomonas eurihalina]MDR5859961.1 alpha/beta hydrolase [Halomonas eurihalina]TZG39857.1 alpha/beta hydrolase [Halomonas eurihalina]